jgi:hypothetical protein
VRSAHAKEPPPGLFKPPPPPWTPYPNTGAAASRAARARNPNPRRRLGSSPSPPLHRREAHPELRKEVRHPPAPFDVDSVHPRRLGAVAGVRRRTEPRRRVERRRRCDLAVRAALARFPIVCASCWCRLCTRPSPPAQTRVQRRRSPPRVVAGRRPPPRPSPLPLARVRGRRIEIRWPDLSPPPASHHSPWI